MATGAAERNPAVDITEVAFKQRPVKHHAAITDPTRVGQLLRDVDEYRGFYATCCALRLAPLVFVRPGELRNARWGEFDLSAKEWRIPAVRMKEKVEHIVPLSQQVVAILKDPHRLTGDKELVFPSNRHRSKPLSENTLNAALRNLGYSKDEMTAHGFRSMASTLLNEQGWNPDAIERQLAHMPKDTVRAAYNRAEHLPERRKMMQAWADYLDGLKSGATVTTIGAAVAIG